MKSMSVDKLSGDALDWAVASADGHLVLALTDDEAFCTRWELAGPLIDKARIAVMPITHVGHTESGAPVVTPAGWKASGAYSVETGRFLQVVTGDTALEAAMRCFVMQKFGAMVDIPQELCK